METGRRTTTVLGFGVAVVVLAVLVWSVGPARVARALLRARPAPVAGVAVAVVGGFVAWSLVLRTVLRSLGVRLPARETLLVYGAAVFASNVTPFGQAGGLFSAWFVASEAGTEYETGLAAVASADATNVVPSVCVALLGVACYAATVGGGRVTALAVGVVGFAVAALVVGLVGWRVRSSFAAGVGSVAASALDRLGSILPVVSPPDPDRAVERVEGFVAAVERVTADRRRLAVALGFSTLGWLCQAAALWAASVSVGVHLPVYVPLFVVPFAVTASAAPTPGGLGSVEAVEVGLLTLVAPVGVATATAAVTVHRLGGYLLTTSLGGGAAALLRARA